MQVDRHGALHLTYCTNIHAADGWPAVEANLRQYAPALRRRFAPTTPFGVGLRLAAHEVVTRRTATTPVLLLDDVFSELDPDRSDALLHSLPAGQTILSTAGALPTGAVPGRVLHVREGVVTSG